MLAMVNATGTGLTFELADELRRRAEEVGLAAVGFAPATPMEDTRRHLEERKAAGLSAGMQFTYRDPARSTDPARLLPGARSLVVGAWRYWARGRGPVPTTDDLVPAGGARMAPGQERPMGRVARYATEDHYAQLKSALGALAGVLEAGGWQARVVADDNALVDRAAAQRAGLGWFGKNTNILLPGLGSWFVLGSVATDAPLPASDAVGPACGACRRCLTSCPTGALVAPGVLDANRCLAWLVQARGVFPPELREALGDRVYGCDDCQEVCPPNRLRPEEAGGDMDSEPPAGSSTAGAGTGQAHNGPGADLLGMLEATDAELMSSYGRWYIPDRDPRYLRRNALLALGNAAHERPGLGRQRDVAAVLAHYLAHSDDLLRAHAIWAAVRAGRDDLVAGIGWDGDSSELVRQELARREVTAPSA